MSKALAENLAHAESCRMERLNPGRKDLPAEDVGSAVLRILSSVASIDRVKNRVAASDQDEVMDLIDSEVDAARRKSSGCENISTSARLITRSCST